MNEIKRARIEALKHSIEITEQRIEETKKPCLARYRYIRSAERDLLRKKLKGYQRELKELEDE
ncbi:hypothetical protein HMPREF9967_1026 [Streptococcus infantis SK1076]|uniref:Uncharacterized protein n=1 Tax=Streptococcus infantis SK1076 TaxID=1005705 RepID=F5W011_9STRE|nr:hypothetical protein [Streptococcus infantis]EGL86880.1 hypothetical protein HMPREF9967_1026 [Streptococcus infantis SK1076]